MKPHVSILTLGVDDLDRAKAFYHEGLGWPIDQERGPWVAFAIAGGSALLGLLPRDALAADAGVSAKGSGFPGFTLSYVVRSEARVDALLAEAEAAGAEIVKPAESAPWGGYSGCFSDPDGYLWKVVAGGGEELSAE